MAQSDSGQRPDRATGVDASLARPGGLSYLEIPATDLQRSAAFYEKVLGWKVEWRKADDPRFGDQTGHLIGRWVSKKAVFDGPAIVPYFYIERIDDVVGRVTANGGELVKGPYPEGDLWIATARDPAGNLIGLWQAGPR
jgi:predicted enzyme related to lactoylglutathione lyase